MRSGICLYSWCTVPRMKFVFCLSARGVQFGFLLKLFAWKGKVSGMSTKFVFVTGGVVSGLGKGICAASLGRLLKQRGGLSGDGVLAGSDGLGQTSALHSDDLSLSAMVHAKARPCGNR